MRGSIILLFAEVLGTGLRPKKLSSVRNGVSA
jgi:hypothetical protein